MEAKSLNVIDTFQPTALNPYGHITTQEGALSDWGELCVCASDHDPNILLAYANYGDDLSVFLTLQATAEGIVDPGGAHLFEAVSDKLDERLWSASFVSQNRLLIMDDAGHLTLLSWPDGHELAFKYLPAAIEHSSATTFWLETDADHLWLGEEVAVIGQTILINVYDDKDFIAMAALHASNLELDRLIYPPLRSLDGLIQKDGNLFAALNSEHRFWRYKPFKSYV